MNYKELKMQLMQSKFRSRFKLSDKDRAYIATKGWNAISEQARKFVIERLAPAWPENDGKQTPMRGHVVFIAQHATATCCRGCLAKWHSIPKGKKLKSEQINDIVEMLLGWLRDNVGDLSQYPQQQDLFDTSKEQQK